MKDVLIIGDSCVDIYVYGSCPRLAPDSPVPVFVPRIEKRNPGMAANVYENIKSLGCRADLLTNGSPIEKKRYVETKTNHMFLRVDVGEKNIDRVEGLSRSLLDPYQAIIISDYNKGFLSAEDIQFIGSNHPLVFIDTKKKIGEFCNACSFIKINEAEYEESHEFLDRCDWASRKLIVTGSGKGCTYGNQDYPVEKVEIKDLCGAGDTFLAALVSHYIKSKDIEKALIFANECATKVVQQKGVQIVKL